MNILYVLYGDFTTNTSNPVVAFATELGLLGHDCVIAVTGNKESASRHPNSVFTAALYEEVLQNPRSFFKNGQLADVIHACTPRQIVCNFVSQYMQSWPTPLCIYLEDNEELISLQYMDLTSDACLNLSSDEIRVKTHIALSHLYQFRSFIGMADLAILIQPKLAIDVPSWVPNETVMLGVDLNFFKPSTKNYELIKHYEIATQDKIIVYHGGLDPLKFEPMRSLCEAVIALNKRGLSTTLIRTGPNTLPFIKELGELGASKIKDIGIVDKSLLPEILNLADVYVQPGEVNEFEDLRLPGKIPEFFAMGKPVFLPNVNIASLFRDQEDVVILNSANPSGMAEQIHCVLKSAELLGKLSSSSTRIAKEFFDLKKQTLSLESAYKKAIANFDYELTQKCWELAKKDGIDVAAIQRAKAFFQKTSNSNPLPQKQCLSLLHHLVDKTYRIDSLGKRVDEQKQMIEQVELDNAKLQNQVNQISADLTSSKGFVNNLEAEIKALRSSHSWKITAPVRWISTKIKMIVKILRKIIGIYDSHGFIKGSAKLCQLALGKLKAKIRGVHHYLDGYQISVADYQKWISEVEGLDVEKLKNSVGKFKNFPLISIVMPTYNSNIKWLGEVIESVRNQVYPHWELCIADDASTDIEVKILLEKYVQLDPRIKVLFREQNGHISNASNSALEMCTGDFVGLLDHDDLLSPAALYWVADAINSNPDLGMIYTDEDKIDARGTRQSPYFKSDWNLDLFYAHNMFSHFGVYRKTVLDHIGGFRVGFEGSQDYDLALRAMEVIGQDGIFHIPKVLYHWRIHQESTAGGASAKPYAMIAGERAINDHFKRMGVSGSVEFTGYGYRPKYEIPSPEPLVSVIIPTRNGLALLKKCIDSILLKTLYKYYEIIVVDNNSDEPEILEYLAGMEKAGIIRVIQDSREFNYSALNNLAAQSAQGKVLALLNNDIEVISPEWMGEMVSHAMRPDIGAVGAKLLYPNNTIQHAGVLLGVGGIANHAHRHFPSEHPGYFSRASLVNCFSAVTAACLFVRKDLYEEAGGLDEHNLSVSFNDIDFCLRLIELGYRNVYTPYALLYHHESATRGYEDNPQKIRRFEKEISYMSQHWSKFIQHDPMYNPNLSKVREDFSLFRPII